MVSVTARLWSLAWPAAPLVLVALFGRNERATWPIVFFTLTLLLPASIAAGRIGGRRWGLGLSAVFAGLLALQIVLPPPIPNRQAATLERRFSERTQAARHVITPPVASPEWRAMWERAAPVQAYVYVLTVLGAEVVQPSLEVTLNEQALGRLDQRSRVHDASPATERHEWHRLPLTRSQIEATARLEFRVFPDPAAPPAPNAVGLVGGFSYRPTTAGQPSAFFDGALWRTDPASVLPRAPQDAITPPQPTDRLRYFVELRLIDTETRRVLAAYY